MKYMMIVVSLFLLVILPAAALAQEQLAQVRVLHASPDAPGVDVLVDGQAVFQKVAFNEMTPYSSLASGSHTLQIVPAGAAKPVLAQATLDLAAGQPYTVVAAGKRALLEPLVLEDEASPPPAGQVRLRFIPVVPNTPAVDLASSGAVLFSNVPFGDSGRYISVSPGTYDLEVQIAGTRVAALTAPGIELQGGTAYTVFATGLAGGIPRLQTVVSVDASRTEAVAPRAATPASAPAAATQVPAEEDGIAPAAMPVTGGESSGISQWVVLSLGLVLVFSALFLGFRSASR